MPSPSTEGGRLGKRRQRWISSALVSTSRAYKLRAMVSKSTHAGSQPFAWNPQPQPPGTEAILGPLASLHLWPRFCESQPELKAHQQGAPTCT